MSFKQKQSTVCYLCFHICELSERTGENIAWLVLLFCVCVVLGFCVCVCVRVRVCLFVVLLICNYLLPSKFNNSVIIELSRFIFIFNEITFAVFARIASAYRARVALIHWFVHSIDVFFFRKLSSHVGGLNLNVLYSFRYLQAILDLGY